MWVSQVCINIEPVKLYSRGVKWYSRSWKFLRFYGSCGIKRLLGCGKSCDEGFVHNGGMYLRLIF